MKKISIITSFLLCVAALCGCGKEVTQNATENESTTTPPVTTSAEATEPVTEAITESPTEAVTEVATTAIETVPVTEAETVAITTMATEIATEAVNTAVDYTAIYKPVLDDCYKLLNDGLEGFTAMGGYSGIIEIVMFEENPSASIGYTIEDISGDGIPELVIATTNSPNDILAVYNCVDNKPHLVFEGATRNHYYMLNDNSFYHNGSAGAIYSIIGDFTLSADGGSLVCKDYYFTHDRNGNFEDVAVYHNVSGTFDVTVSEETALTIEEFSKLSDNFIGNLKSFSVNAFSEYTYNG